MAHVESIASAKFPIEAALTPKAGSRFVLNLFYYIDNEKFYDAPMEIREAEGFNVLKPKRAVAKRSNAKFVLIRHPSERFAAFYFGDIYWGQSEEYQNWRNRLKSAGFDFGEGISIETHQANALKLIDLMEEKIERHGIFSVSEDYSPQVKTVISAQDRGFIPIDLQRVNIDLAAMLRPFLPEIDDVIGELTPMSLVQIPIDVHQFVSGKLKDKLRKVYAMDYEFYEALRYGTA